jgi:peptide/nickel transport system substrate-binding protein
VLPEHRLRDVAPDRLAASPFAREPVGSGRFRFGRWERGQRLELDAVRDHWRGRAKLDRVVWAFAPDFGTATIRLLAGDADFLENLRPETLGQMTRSRALRLVPYPSLDYGFLQFNLRASDASGTAHPLFADRELRRALTMAVDRERVVRNVFDSLAYPAVGRCRGRSSPTGSSCARSPTTWPARGRCSTRSAGATPTATARASAAGCRSPSACWCRRRARSGSASPCSRRSSCAAWARASRSSRWRSASSSTG